MASLDFSERYLRVIEISGALERLDYISKTDYYRITEICLRMRVS